MINEKMRELGAVRSAIRELYEYGKMRKAEIGEDKVFDFSLGNPSTPPPDAVTHRIRELIDGEEPVALHGYTSAQGDFEVRRAIAEHINNTYGESITPECLYMATGAAGALTATLTALVCAGEEVVVPSPYFPEYRVFIERCGASLVAAPCDSETMELDIASIERAISEKCAAVIINSPNNPTGKIYGEDTIIALCELLERKASEYNKPIYLISDEPYRELAYGGRSVPFLTKYYKDTVVCYSFSKSLSIPGERIGYVLTCPRMRELTSVYQAICGAARALGYVCAPSLLQKLIPACLGMTADIGSYERNRELLLSALSEYGYELIMPEGAFYLFIKCPGGDANAFCEAAKKKDILMVPSDSFGCTGYARISYCVSYDTVKNSLPAFKQLIEEYGDG